MPDYPFAPSDPPDPAVELTLLFDVVNEESDIFASDGKREAFFQVWRIDGRKATPAVVDALRTELQKLLRQFTAAKRRPQIEVVGTMTSDHRGRPTFTPRPKDFGDRLRYAAQQLAQSGTTVRECRECDRFFQPRGPARYCTRCQGGSLVRALRLEKLERRVLKSQHRRTPLSTAEKQQSCRDLEERLRQLAASNDPRDNAETGEITNQIATLKRRRRPGLTVHVHGIQPEDVHLPPGAATARTVKVVAAPLVSKVIHHRQLSSRELLEQYRTPRRRANTAPTQKTPHRR